LNNGKKASDVEMGYEVLLVSHALGIRPENLDSAPIQIQFVSGIAEFAVGSVPNDNIPFLILVVRQETGQKQRYRRYCGYVFSSDSVDLDADIPRHREKTVKAVYPFGLSCQCEESLCVHVREGFFIYLISWRVKVFAFHDDYS
jgi:hypothetical protein